MDNYNDTLKEMVNGLIEISNQPSIISVYHVLSILPTNDKESVNIFMKLYNKNGKLKNIALKIPYNMTNPNDIYKMVSIYHRIKDGQIVVLNELEIFKRVEEIYLKNPYVLKETILFNEISRNIDLPQCSQSEYDKHCYDIYDVSNGNGFYNSNVWIEYNKWVSKNK